MQTRTTTPESSPPSAISALPAAPADVVLLGGKILTVDAQNRVCSALAIRGERIVAVGSDAEIAEFCSTRFDVTFPMFAKVDVNGATAHPLFQWLKSEQKGIFGTESIKWNFTKFLIGPDGHVIKRYGSADTPEDIAKDV